MPAPVLVVAPAPAPAPARSAPPATAATPPPAPAPVPDPPAAREDDDGHELPPPPGDEYAPPPDGEGEPPPPPVPAPVQAPAGEPPLALVHFGRIWSQVLDTLERDAPPLRGFLDGSHPDAVDADELLVAVTSAVRASMLDNPDNRRRVGDAVERVTGHRLTVRFAATAVAGAPHGAGSTRVTSRRGRPPA